jgi:outer membrane protein
MQIRNIWLAISAITILSSAAAAADLAEVYTLAQRHDAQFRAETANYHAARQQAPLARSALLPQIAGAAAVSETSTSSEGTEFVDTNADGVPDTSILTNYDLEADTTNWNVSLRQSLYSHANWKRLQQANALVAQAEAEYEAAKQNLILRTAEAYFNVLSAEDNLTFAAAETRAVGQQLEQARQRFEVGLIAITDVKESQAQYDNAIASEIQASNLLDSAREALWILTNSTIPKLAKLGENLVLQPPEPQDKQQWVDRALSDNLQLLSARFAYEIAGKEVSVQRSGHYPTLDLVARRNFTDNDAGLFGLNEQTMDYVGVELSVPIFSGGGVRASVKQAIYRRDASKEQLEFTQRSVVQQARNAYQNTLADISRVNALKQALISSQAAYEATEAGFEVGTRNSVEVLLSLRNTFGAERDYAATRYNYLLNTLRLKQAAGNLQVSDLQIINSWLQK